MSEENFNGYKNRETWCLNLWLNNDVGFETWCLGRAIDVTNRSDKPDAINELGNIIKEYIEGNLTDFKNESPQDSQVRIMFDDIGSLWHVDYNEIAEGFVDAALE